MLQSRFFLISCLLIYSSVYMGFPGCASGKEPSCQCRGHKRHGAWRAIVHGVTKSQIWLKQLSMQAHSVDMSVYPCPPLPPGNRVCFLHLWLYFCFVNRFICILFFFFKIPHNSSVTQSCPSLCDLMDCSMPGLPVQDSTHKWYHITFVFLYLT